MGYWMMLGIFPIMFFLMSIFSWLGKKSLMTHVLGFFNHILPKDAYQLIEDVLKEETLNTYYANIVNMLTPCSGKKKVSK